MVSAVTGFVDGFFKGRDWRDSKEDRKLDRERQTRLDKLNEEKHGALMDQYRQMAGLRDSREARAAESHDYRTRELDYIETERDRKAREAAEEREFWHRMSGDLGANPDGAPAAAPNQDERFPIGTVEGQGAPAPQQAPVPARPDLSFGALPNSVAPTAPAAAPTAPAATVANETDEEFAARVAAQRQRTNQVLQDTAPGSVVTGGGGDAAGGEGNDRLQPERTRTRPVNDVDPSSSAFGQDVQGVKRSNAIHAGLSRIATNLATEGSSPVGRALGAVKDYFGATPEEGESNKQRRAATQEAHQWYQSDDAYAFFDANPDQLEAAAQDPVGFYASVAGQGGGSAPVPGSPSDKVPDKAADAEDASGAPEPQQAANMSIEAAVDAAHDPKVSLGLKPGQNLTERQKDAGADAYIDRYYETVVPQAVQFYMSRGETEKAQAFIELVESRQGKAALKDIGRSTFAILNGDYDSAAEHMLSAFQQYGYADPNMEVDLEETGIIHDDSGQPAGGKVVFRDKKTGKTFEKSFATADEFIKYGHMMISPATVADLLFEKKPEEKGAITQQDIMKGATEIMKADMSGQTTMEQAIQQYMQGLGALGVSVGGRRGGGQQTEPPLYRLQ